MRRNGGGSSRLHRKLQRRSAALFGQVGHSLGAESRGYTEQISAAKKARRQTFACLRFGQRTAYFVLCKRGRLCYTLPARERGFA
jgi:hypothetical protein